MLGIKSEKKRFYDKFWFYNFQNTLKKKQTTCFKAKPIFMHFFFWTNFTTYHHLYNLETIKKVLKLTGYLASSDCKNHKGTVIHLCKR